MKKKNIFITTNYKNGRGNFHDCFRRIIFFTIKSTFFIVHFGDDGGAGKANLYTCENVDKCEQPLNLHLLDKVASLHLYQFSKLTPSLW